MLAYPKTPSQKMPYALRYLKAVALLMVCQFLLGVDSTEGQQFTSSKNEDVKIILGYPLIQDWLDKAQGSPREQRRSLFKQFAVRPLLGDCFPGLTEDEAMKILEGTSGNPADWDLSMVKRELAELESHRFESSAIIRTAFASSESQLRSPMHVNACVFYFSGYWGAMRDQFSGVFGFTPSGTSIRLFIAPVGDWLHWISCTLAHEYHHAVWMQSHPGTPAATLDLLNTLVFEGRGDHFAKLVTGLDGPWTRALSREQECNVFVTLSPQLHDRKLSWFTLNHSPDGKFPQWAGYTMGWKIVGAYLEKHPNTSIESWTSLPASDVLRESGYTGGCQQTN